MLGFAITARDSERPKNGSAINASASAAAQQGAYEENVFYGMRFGLDHWPLFNIGGYGNGPLLQDIFERTDMFASDPNPPNPCTPTLPCHLSMFCAMRTLSCTIMVLLSMSLHRAHATKLTDAISSGDEQKCIGVVDLGVDVSEDAGGFQAIHYAANKGMQKLIAKLLSKGAAVNSVDMTHQTPLHHAAFAGQRRVASYLLDQGGFMDKQDITGRTAMYNAASQGHLEIVRLLMLYGADTELGPKSGKGGGVDMRSDKEKDAEGATPLLEVRRAGSPQGSGGNHRGAERGDSMGLVVDGGEWGSAGWHLKASELCPERRVPWLEGWVRARSHTIR